MKHFDIVTADNGLDIAIVGPETYRTFAPESRHLMKEMKVLNMLNRAYEAGLKNGHMFSMYEHVKWSKMPKETFKVIGITRTDVLIEGDFSGIGITQSSWVPVKELKREEP